MAESTKERNRAEAAAIVVPNEAMRRALLKASELRGWITPKVCAMTMRPAAGRAYRPAAGCGAKLKPKAAISYYYAQESYADHSRYLIPVEGDLSNAAACRSNLAALCESMRTHNGFAGSGCTYSAELVIESDGAYVVLDCRASISD